jgi:hypothetical protein
MNIHSVCQEARRAGRASIFGDVSCFLKQRLEDLVSYVTKKGALLEKQGSFGIGSIAQEMCC